MAMRWLKQGESGYDVARWQAFLASEQLLTKAGADGDFGPNTESATKTFQAQRGLAADGIIGTSTIAAAQALGFVPPRGPDDFSDEVLGLDSRKYLSTIHPDLADLVVELAKEAKDRHEIISVIPWSGAGLRTFAKQQELYDRGRVKPGYIVTNAGPGQSYHNYGLAVDIHTWKNEQIDWNDVQEARLRGPIGRKLGLEWGGDWRDFTDLPHFQLTMGLQTADCLALYRQGGIIAVVEEVTRRSSFEIRSLDIGKPEGEHVE